MVCLPVPPLPRGKTVIAFELNLIMQVAALASA
jgi:hypothetical protein